LHYLDWGNDEAPTLLLVHGNRDHCHNWDWVAQEMRDDYHVIAPDFRGHGDSQWVIGSSYTHSEYVYDLAQLIHQQHLAPLNIIAHSLGGGIALRYAGVYPDNVLKMIVIEGVGGPSSMVRRVPVHMRMRNWIESARKISGRLPKRYESLEDAFERMHEANSHLRIDQARHLTIHGSDQNEDGSYSWKFDNYTHVMAPFDMNAEETRELWQRIQCPLLLISGAESWNRRAAREDPGKQFRDARHVTVKNAGHWVHHDQLDEFLSLSREFLASA
jgi:pimeloyl-ACP methyl ester carboxylesterase|tara:strand:- start:968 stop:1786 length:819 start_codon:yes stop_codon:yes gene_type:complete